MNTTTTIQPERLQTRIGFASCAAMLALAALFVGDPLASADAPPTAASMPSKPGAVVLKSSITVIVEGFKNDDGDALFALFRSSEGFPKEPLKAAARIASHIAQHRTEVTFPGLEAGDFAISVLHDADRDKKLKTGLFGIPTEGVGFSRNALGSFGPPSWDDARMRLSPSVHLTIKLKIHYY